MLHRTIAAIAAAVLCIVCVSSDAFAWRAGFRAGGLARVGGVYRWGGLAGRGLGWRGAWLRPGMGVGLGAAAVGAAALGTAAAYNNYYGYNYGGYHHPYYAYGGYYRPGIGLGIGAAALGTAAAYNNYYGYSPYSNYYGNSPYNNYSGYYNNAGYVDDHGRFWNDYYNQDYYDAIGQ
jgi:hypothetical protein